MPTYRVKVRTTVGTTTTHSDHTSYRDAIDQSDLAGGLVVVVVEYNGSDGLTDMESYWHACAEQGYQDSLHSWRQLDDDERDAYETGE